MNIPTIHIMTSARGSIDSIDRMMMSVIAQTGRFNIRQHVSGGASGEETLERFAWWRNIVEHRHLSVQCNDLHLSVSADGDGDDLEAFLSFLQTLAPGRGDFVTWLRPGQILMPGALAFVAEVGKQFDDRTVSWLIGPRTALENDQLTLSADPVIPAEAIRSGLCDGVSRPILTRDGMFFRRHLADAIGGEAELSLTETALARHIFRCFAQQTELVHCPQPLAVSISSEPLERPSSGVDQPATADDGIVSDAEPRRRFAELVRAKVVVSRRLRPGSPSRAMSLIEEPVEFEWTTDAEAAGGEIAGAGLKTLETASRVVAEGQPEPDPPATVKAGGNRLIRHGRNLCLYDRAWQYPALTEFHAFRQLSRIADMPSGVTYVAYPWATLIDKIEKKAGDAETYLEEFELFAGLIPPDTVKVTVCQHIHMMKHIHLMERCGITEIFWSHATEEHLQHSSALGPRIRPFPLFPVQFPEGAPAGRAEPRKHLFSFVGSRPTSSYFNDARDLIFHLLGDDPRGVLLARDRWHYHAAVYEHQIAEAAPFAWRSNLDAHVDPAASAEFRQVLADSIFALCPAGSGPNSIRLWEAVAADTIPVIIADGYAPPGNRKLWDAAAVFCTESEAAIAALPSRLAAIADDPLQLGQMRAALAQLRLLYGASTFIHDLDLYMLTVAGHPHRPGSLRNSSLRLARQVRYLLRKNLQISGGEAEKFVSALASDLLLERHAILPHLDDDDSLGKATAAARGVLGGGDPASRHLDRVLEQVRPKHPERPAAPFTARGALPRISLFGRRSNRTPLSYPPFKRLMDGLVEFMPDPSRADLVVTGMNVDFEERAGELEGLRAAGARAKLVVLSEEPYWDTTRSGGFEERNRVVQAEDGTPIPYTYLNHHNSTIFDFESVPYFLLTNDEYIVRYRLLLSRFDTVTPSELLRRWRGIGRNMAFFAERREGATFEGGSRELHVFGLSSYRTDVALHLAVRPEMTEVLTVGKGWGDGPLRQNLPDWHLDKLGALDGNVRMASAYENTHQRNYVSEKMFDAYATGCLPIYFADPFHRVHEIAEPGSFLNTFDLSALDAAAMIARFEPDADTAAAVLATADGIRRRLKDSDAVARERRRVVDRTLTELQKVLDTDAP